MFSYLLITLAVTSFKFPLVTAVMVLVSFGFKGSPILPRKVITSFPSLSFQTMFTSLILLSV